MEINDKGNVRKKSGLRMLLCILGAYLLYSFSSVMSKLASRYFLSAKFFMFLFALIGVMGVYALIYQQLIKRMHLSDIYSFKGIVVIYNLVWAAGIFGEEISIWNLVGSIVILTGIYLVGRND